MLKASLAALMLLPQMGSSKRIHKKWAMMGRFIQGLFIMSILAPMPWFGSYYCYCTVLLLTINNQNTTTYYKYPSIFLITY